MAKKPRSRKKTAARRVTIRATATIKISIPHSLVDAIDSWGKESGTARSEAIRLLIEAGLRQKRGNLVAGSIISRRPD